MGSYKKCDNEGSGIACTCSTKRDSDYLRFRPYDAFTAQTSKSNRWTTFWRTVLIVGALALLIFSGKLLLLAIA